MSWSAVDAIVRNGLNFLVLTVLSRLLTPADFGLLAMLMLFVALATLLVDSGFSQALIQRQQTTIADESTIFFFSLATGVVIALCLCALAPWIAAFYGQPLLKSMTYWMALNLFLDSVGIIHTTLLTKNLDFQTITISGGVAALCSGGVAIVMALQGLGAWSLVGKVLAATMIKVALMWWLNPWRPQWVFRLASLRSCFKFGGFLLWTGLLYTIYTNLYALLIGKLHTVQQVGFYTQGQRLQQLPVTIMTSIVGRVAFPIFSTVAEDKVRLVQGLRRALSAVMFINVPLMLWLMILAEPLVLTLLGAQWLPSVPVLRVLTVGGLMWPLHSLNINVLKAQGHSALNARLQLLRLGIAILLLIATSPHGILAVAYGQVVSSLLAFSVNAYYSKKMLDYGGFTQLCDVASYMVAALPMLLVVIGILHFFDFSPQLQLVLTIVPGVLVYFASCRLGKLGALEELFVVMKGKTT